MRNPGNSCRAVELEGSLILELDAAAWREELDNAFLRNRFVARVCNSHLSSFGTPGECRARLEEIRDEEQSEAVMSHIGEGGGHLLKG